MNYRKNTKPETKWANWKRLFSSLTVVALAASASYANAADVTSETELKAAISAGDTNITIPANTVITLTSALPEIGYNTVISGAADGSSVIDGASSYTAFSIASNATVTIKGLTIQNTYLALVDLAGTQKGGAAIYNQGTLTVEECHFANNKVDGSVAVAARGGAVYSTGTLNLLYSSFFSNMSEGGDTITDGAGRPVSLSTVGRGGALYIENQGTVQNCTFSGNTAKGGDGHGKDPDIAGGAGAHAYGGAIAVAANATVLVDFVTMVDNQAQGGNTELSEGGGVTGAGEGHGGAIYTASSTLTVRNTIFINSRQSTGVVTASSEPDIDGNFIDGGGNLFNSPTTSVEAVQKASNGTFVYPINKTSPAYNQAAAVDTVTRDQRNVARPRPNAMEGTGYDIGAYQLGVWTVVADDKTRPYNTENPELTYYILDPDGEVVTSTISGMPDLNTTAVITSPVGDYPITVTQGTLDPALDYIYQDGTLTITSVALTVTAEDKSRLYNTPNPTLTYIITDAAGEVVSVSGTAEIGTDAVISSPIGEYPIVVTQGTLDPNYTYTFVDGTLTINPAPLTVTADNKTRPYNTENPTLTYVITDPTGAVVSVGGEAAISTTAVISSPVGDYPITVTQGSLDSNYTYTFVPGTLTITPASLIVTADDKTRPYNTENPVLTYVITDGSGTVVSVTGEAAISTTAVKESPVGDYPITVAQGTLDSNYTYTFVPGTLTITPASLIVTAEDKTRPYNTDNPVLTYVITDGSGAVVTVPGTPALSTTAVKESPVGEYPITVTKGSLSDNYTYTFVNGTLTITPVALTVTADDKTRPYNTENPALTYKITDGSGAAVTVPGTPAISTTAVKESPVGEYPITIAQGTLDSNYTYTFVNGTLTITPVALTVKADDKTRPYNTENPELTYKITDASGAAVTVTGTPALSTTAVKESPVGEYPITVAQGTLDSNYTYTFINGTLTITAIDVRVALPGCERLYGQRNIDATNDFTGGLITMTVEDLLFYYDGTWHPYADVKSSVEGAPVFYTLGYDYKGKVGNYAVKVYPGSFKGKNMNFELLPTGELCSNEANSADPLTAHLGDYLRILPVDLHITAYADPAVVVSGETPTYKYYYGITNEVTGEVHGYFVNNETEADLISKPRARLTDLFVDITVDGIYTITPYGAQSENYNIIRHDGQFAVYGSKPSMEEGPLPRNYDMDGGEFNPYQIKGLYEQLVLVKNTTSETWTGIELYASNVQGGTVVNALNYSNGAYRMLHNYAVAPDEIVAFVVKFNIPSGNSLKDYPTYNYVPLYAGINDKTEERVCATGDAVQVENFAVVDVPTYNTEDWTFDTADAAPCALKYLERYGWAAWVNVGTYLKISNLTKGSVYEIQYSADGTNWTPVLPNFVATDTTYEWTDKGAPETEAHPLVGHQTTNLRLYRVIKVK